MKTTASPTPAGSSRASGAFGRLGAAVAVAGVLATLSGCPAVYPELGTRTTKVPSDRPVEPPPPDDLRWMRVLSAEVPPHTRDGREWSRTGRLPDPYAKLLVNGEEIFRTPVESGTLKPTWPNGPRGNFRITPDDRLRVEVWDKNPINDKPIGVRDIGRPSEEARIARQIRVEIEGGGEVILAFEPAHAVLGLGLWYELRNDACFVTRLLEQSPAARAGLEKGDEILRLAGKNVKATTPDDVQSLWNAVPMAGISVTVRHASGATQEVLLKEGPIYPLFSQFGPVD
jgi:hypothetical protein